MEKRGLVNVYECNACGENIVTVNLCTGVTPASAPCPFCAEPMGMWSRWYDIKTFRKLDPLRVTHVWYRPARPESIHPLELDHVRRGGLLLASLGEACVLTDPEPEGEEWETWRPWLEARYGKAD